MHSSYSSLINIFASQQIKAPLSKGWSLFFGTSGSPGLYGYDRIRGGAQQPKAVEEVTLPASASTIKTIASSPAGDHVVAGSDNFMPYLRIYRRQPDNTIMIVPGTPVAPGGVIAAEYSPDGRYLALALEVAPYVMVLERNGETYTVLPEPESGLTEEPVTQLDTFLIRANNSSVYRGYWASISQGAMLEAPTVYPVNRLNTQTTDSLLYLGFPDEDMKATLAGCYVEIEGYGTYSVDAADAPIVIGGSLLTWPKNGNFVNDTQYRVRIWSGNPDGGVSWYPASTEQGRCVAWSPDGTQLALGYYSRYGDGLQNSFEVFDIEEDTGGTRLISRQLNISVNTEGDRVADNVLVTTPTAMAFYPDGSGLLIGLASGAGARLFETDDYTESTLDIDIQGVEEVLAITINPSGDLMVLGNGSTENPILAYRRVEGTEPSWVLMGVYFPNFPSSNVRGLAFSADGRYIAAAIDDSPRLVVYRVRRTVGIDFVRHPNPVDVPLTSGNDVAFMMKA
jgi:WD40 repeat protein